MEGLSGEKRSQLQLFQEVTAESRDTNAAIQLLSSCNWNVEQALQLHLASAEDDHGAASGAGSGDLGEPLLTREANHAQGDSAVATEGGGGWLDASRFSLFEWIGRGIRRIGVSVFNILCTFIFGPGGPMLGPSSGAAFSRALTNSYGAQLQLPSFFEGSFAQSLQQARRDLKLLVVYLHSEHSRNTSAFVTQVLSNEFVRTMLDESFLLWGGDIARMESHQVSQMIHARQYPCFCVLLPASVDDIRVIGALNGQVEVDAAVSLLTACLEEMETHRAEIVARREQQSEDRQLREQQDREYQEAMEVDRKRAEEQAAREREEREAQRLQEEQRKAEEERLAKIEADKAAVEARRRSEAAELAPESEGATARVAMRLPAGQRIQRRFLPSAKLSDVYKWAFCAPFLPENEGKGLEVPARFVLRTTFPSKDLTEMESTIQDLQLSGSNILLAAVEDED